jgi:hypothetical protein
VTNEQDRLAYALATLRRAAEHGYLWSISPAEAAALVAEVQQLRAIIGDQQILLDEHRMDNQHAYEEGGNAERAAVVAWLRAEAFLTLYEATPSDVADAIERGEHRREETK